MLVAVRAVATRAEPGVPEARWAPDSFLVLDMPFLTYQVTPEEGKLSAAETRLYTERNGTRAAAHAARELDL